MAWAAGEARDSQLDNWLGVDLFVMVQKADFLGKACLVILAICSIMSWMVIIYKFLHIRQSLNQTDSFIRICNHGSGRLDEG